MIIWLSCAGVAFFIVGMPMIICPTQNVFSAAELSAHNGKGSDAYVAIRGFVYDLGAFAPNHYPSIIPVKSILSYGGLDVTSLFPVQVSALCNGVDGSVDPSILLDYTSTNTSGSANVISTTDTNWKYHDFRYFNNDSRVDWFWEQTVTLKANYKKGNLGYTAKYVAELADKRQSIAIIHGKVYDFTKYITSGGALPQKVKYNETIPDINTNFMEPLVVDLFRARAGQDVSKYWDDLKISTDVRKRMDVCLRNLFYVGDVDTRKNPPSASLPSISY